jgi:hypothetical protein
MKMGKGRGEQFISYTRKTLATLARGKEVIEIIDEN